VLASYTLGDIVWSIVLFLIWCGFVGAIGVGVWLLIRLFRNQTRRA